MTIFEKCVNIFKMGAYECAWSSSVLHLVVKKISNDTKTQTYRQRKLQKYCNKHIALKGVFYYTLMINYGRILSENPVCKYR